MKLFDRIAKVTIRRTVQSRDERRFFVTETSQVEITGLRIKFKVERHLGSEPNTCEITITNLSEATRAELGGDGLVVSLAAGHDNVARHLFTGDVRWSQSVQDGPDMHTTLLLGDGSRAYAQARGVRSYRGGTPVLTVVRDAARSMGLVLPKDVEQSPALRASFAAGYALEGPTRDELARLLAPFGYSWSIQDGKLQVLRDGDVAPGAEREISGGPGGTGMIGSPSFAPPEAGKRQKKRPVLTVQSILYPELKPGAAIRLVSRQINGRFRIESARHEGDTHGDEWDTTVEGKAA